MYIIIKIQLKIKKSFVNIFYVFLLKHVYKNLYLKKRIKKVFLIFSMYLYWKQVLNV